MWEKPGSFGEVREPSLQSKLGPINWTLCLKVLKKKLKTNVAPTARVFYIRHMIRRRHQSSRKKIGQVRYVNRRLVEILLIQQKGGISAPVLDWDKNSGPFCMITNTTRLCMSEICI